MRGFEIIGTTADVGIVARGRTLAELFENAAVGMFAIIFGGASCQVDASDQKRIHLFSSDAEALLVAWLSELLWYFDEIKAVTMHNLKITRRGENISARIIFDI